MVKRVAESRFWGIEERVLFVALMPATVIALVLAAYFLVLRYGDVEQSLVTRGRALARQLSPAAQYGVFSGNRDELRHLAETLSREPDVTAVTIYDRDGSAMASAGKSHFGGKPNDLPEGWEGASHDQGILLFHAKIVHRFQPFGPDLAASSPQARGDFYPIGSVMLELSRAGLMAQKAEMLTVTAIFTLIVLAAGGLLAYRLGRDVLEPIVTLEHAVAAIRAGDLDIRVPLHRAGTLRALEEGVNDMAEALQAGRDRLEQRIAAATAELKEKKEEAERSNLAKSRFLAAASHDLRQPLHALSLFAAELELATRNTPQQRLARQIGAAAGVMSELLESLLEISRLDATTVRTVREDVPLGPLLDRVCSHLAPSAEAKGLRLRFVSTGLWINTDRRLLERMLANLVANAVRYTEHGGVSVGARRSGSEVRIEVWDTGVGVKPEYQQLIFQEFFQVGNPERDPGKGLGLGLAIVDRMAQRLGHRVTLRSRPQRGSVFAITVPRARRPQTDRSGADVVPVELGGRALVICPPGQTCDSLCALLRSWGVHTRHMEGVSASEARSLGVPDVVVFDEARSEDAARLRALLSGGNGRAIAWILLGNAPADIGGMLPAGSYLRLGKPLRPAKLRALMHAVLQASTAPLTS